MTDTVHTTPVIVAAPAVVVAQQQPTHTQLPYGVAPGAHSAPPVVMKQDARVTGAIKHINYLMLLFAIVHFLGALLFLAGNAAALNGPFRNYHRFIAGLRLLIAGSVIMAVGAIILHIAHAWDIKRSRDLGITNFLVYSSFITSTSFALAYFLWSVGFGLVYKYFHENQDRRRHLSAGLIIVTVGTFIAALGVFHSFVGHWGSLEARSRNRVPHHTFSPSHLRAWALSAGNFDFMIGWVIYVVAILSAAINETLPFLYQLFIVGIITAVFFMLGDLRTIYLTMPGRALYTDMPPMTGPGVAANPFPSAYAAPVSAV